MAELVICLILAVAATWPMPRSAATAIPLGYEATPTVPLLNAWTVWWNTDRVAHGLTNYWQAPIFFPEAQAFAFSEAQPLTIAVSVLVGLHGPVLAYNVYLLASLMLNGWMALRLLQELGHSRTAAWAGSGLVLTLPFVHWQVGVLQLIPLWGILWTLLELVRLERPVACGGRAAAISGLRLGLAFGVTYLLCNYYGLFLSVLLTLSAPWLLGRRLLQRVTWLSLGISALSSALIVSPVVLTQLQAAGRNDQWTRDAELVKSLSAQPADYTSAVVVRPLQPGAWSAAQRASVWRLSPGWMCTLFAGTGILFGLRGRQHRSWTACSLSLVIWSFLYSLGVTYDWTPYHMLASLWPGFDQIRSPFRFAVFVQLGLALLAAGGLDAVSRLRMRRSVAVAIVLVPAGLAVLENWPRRAVLTDIPLTAAGEHWSRWLNAHTPREAVLTCLPLPNERSAEAYVTESEWMFWQTVHQRRMTNGYSGFFPDSYWELEEACRSFPSTEAIDFMRERGVEYCVVHRGRLSTTQREELAQRGSELPLLYDDAPRQISVHRLARP